MASISVSTFGRSSQEIVELLNAKITPGKPSFFKIACTLPAQGRIDIPLAATEFTTVMLKAYASGGENELHAHVHEDHVFIVLQGQACFFGPHGEEQVVSRHEGVNMPRGTYYWFKSVSDEPLVMVRFGAATTSVDPRRRIGIDGQPMSGFAKENKEVPLVLSEQSFE